jgi:hypothetical protein
MIALLVGKGSADGSQPRTNAVLDLGGSMARRETAAARFFTSSKEEGVMWTPRDKKTPGDCSTGVFVFLTL